MKKLIPFILVLPLMAFDNPKPSVAWDIVEGLTTEVGQRLAGTEAEARARDWAVIKLKSLGFKNVHIETYDMPVWVRGTETAEVISPFPQKLMLTALGNSGATAEGGLTADIVMFKSLDELKAAPEAAVKGKIIYVTHQMMAKRDGADYGKYGAVRFIGAGVAAQKGAAAYLIRSLATDNKRSPHTGVTHFADSQSAIPAAALAIPDADNLERMITRAKTPIKLHLTLTPKQNGIHQSGNVVAEVPGSDPKAGIITIGGHLDSWDLGTGAIDDGAGVAITAAAAKKILDGPMPKRTIRVVWWGSEEEGGFGSDAYFAAHKGENNVLVGESDFGADNVYEFSYKLPATAASLGERLKTEFAKIGVSYNSNNAHGGADVEKLGENGVAVIDLKQDGTHYFDLHHSPDDTLDKIDPVTLNQNVDAWALMLRLVANAPEDLSVKPTVKK